MAGQPLRPALLTDALIIAWPKRQPRHSSPSRERGAEKVARHLRSGPWPSGSGLGGRQPPIEDRPSRHGNLFKTAGPPIRTTGPKDPPPHTTRQPAPRSDSAARLLPVNIRSEFAVQDLASHQASAPGEGGVRPNRDGGG